MSSIRQTSFWDGTFFAVFLQQTGSNSISKDLWPRWDFDSFRQNWQKARPTHNQLVEEETIAA